MRTDPNERIFAARMLAVADALLREFPDLPLVEVVTAINAARQRLTLASDEAPDPDRIAGAARERLAARALTETTSA